MIKVTRKNLSVKQEKEIEDAVAQTIMNRDALEYIAMMSDVDLGADENVSGGDSNEQ